MLKTKVMTQSFNFPRQYKQNWMSENQFSFKFDSLKSDNDFKNIKFHNFIVLKTFALSNIIYKL